ncbi:portal protein [Mycobacterium phage Madruga]|uniref:Portal protein n=1 Tax=Mycobacterium phage Madruga TaxID=1675552 RepID=A0A0K1LRU5_9CAUD|nr:portal protein [Mycobacterium phage Madruga]
MPYNKKQYAAALDFIASKNDNVTNVDDQRRIAAYDLYESIYTNSTVDLKIVLRGDDQTPILMPSGQKIIEATHRFLGLNVGYFVDEGGDEGTRQLVDQWWEDFFKREAFPAKFTSNKRWGLIRGDAAFYVYASDTKGPGRRISVVELDPRQLFEIEVDGEVIGVHIVEDVQDFREPDKPEKRIARRRTFRKRYLPDGIPGGISSELTFWELGKWDDRDPVSEEKMERVTGPEAQLREESEYMLPPTIMQLPVYKWRNKPPQNSTWGHSQLSGLETLLYAINQTLSDEDATIVFQGLGMYVTTSGPPRDPQTGEVTDWNIGPKQIIEIGNEQKFERVTGVTDMTPFTQHMDTIDKGMSEASGTPEIAIGRVDVSVAESGISLQMQLAPLLAQNSEKELEIITVLDQMFHDITTMWLPAYEPELFGNAEVMAEINVVCLFDDPMPKNRDAEIQEVVLLDSSNLILKSMAVAKLRKLGWQFPTVDAFGNPLTDDDIAAMLIQQQAALAAAMDPFSVSLAGGNPEETSDQPEGNTPDDQTIDLGVTG